MLRPLRRRLRRIRYYSAHREETAWTRGADAALFITLGLALPMVLLCDAVAVRPFIVMEQPGALDRRDGGGVHAHLAAAEGVPAWSRDTFGYFTLQLVVESRGWPMTTSTHTRPLRIEYDLFHEPERRFDLGEANDEPLRQAIGEALGRGSHTQLLQSWRIESPHRTNEPLLRWLFGAGLWWILLYIAAMFALGAARLGALLWQRQSAKRIKRLARAGCCIHCGYDLRGTEFSERCPECGELA
jgi:hypothetical protein